MGQDKNEGPEDWEGELIRSLARRLPGLDREIFRPGKKSLLADGDLSLRHWRGRWLAVVRGSRSDGGGAVVCFGAGETPLHALRNVSAACAKGEFKQDRYAAKGRGQPRLLADTAVPLGGVEGYSVGGDFQPPLPVAK